MFVDKVIYAEDIREFRGKCIELIEAFFEITL